MLAWKEAYSTGFPDIDDQHKRLFQVINNLGNRIEEGKGEEYLDETLEFLEDYVKAHFSYEEDCMFKHKCPVALENQKAHKRFIEGYESYCERYHRRGATKDLAEDIHAECERWMVEHICKIDTHLKECIHSTHLDNKE